MWIIQEPKKVALWNKQHFEEKNGECAACLKYSVLIFVGKKYIKCNIWRVAVCPSHIQDAQFLKVNFIFFVPCIINKLLQFKPMNALNFIKITIILQHTSSYMFWALVPIIMEHTIVQNSSFKTAACHRVARNSPMDNIHTVGWVVHWKL